MPTVWQSVYIHSQFLPVGKHSCTVLTLPRRLLSITGEIPSSVGDIVPLQILLLDNNNLKGEDCNRRARKVHLFDA